MRVIQASLAILMLLVASDPALPADQNCDAFPAGSLAQRECAHVEAVQKEPTFSAETQSHRLGTNQSDRGAITTFRCPDETAFEINGLTGVPGGEVRGTYTNPGPKPVHEVIVDFALFSARHKLLDTIDAAVVPRTIPSGGSGTFTTHMPSPAGGGRTCFRYEITGLVN